MSVSFLTSDRKFSLQTSDKKESMMTIKDNNDSINSHFFIEKYAESDFYVIRSKLEGFALTVESFVCSLYAH